MADIRVQMLLQGGAVHQVELPDDLRIRDFLDEMIEIFKLPRKDPGDAFLAYELFSKNLGRKLNETETLREAGVPDNDLIHILTANIPGKGF